MRLLKTAAKVELNSIFHKDFLVKKQYFNIEFNMVLLFYESN